MWIEIQLVFGKVSGKLFLENRRGPNPEGSQFCQSGAVPILSIRRGPKFANPEGLLFLPIQRVTIFANPNGSCFCQSGGVLFLPIRRGLVFANPVGY